MKQLTIKKNGVITHGPSPFSTEEELKAHLKKHESMGTYGQVTYTAKVLIAPEIPAVIGENEEILVEAIPAVYEDQEVPADYEVIEEDITVQLEKQNFIAEMEKLGERDEAICRKVLNVIAGFNRSRQMTFEQITQMQTLFSNAEKALRSSRPDFALTFIQQIAVDGIIVTQEMRDLCIELLVDY